jgi:uncharacterized protein
LAEDGGFLMKQKTIYNCHTHIFTHENIPNGFFPFYGVQIARIPFFRWVLKGAMKWLVRFERFQRYAAYLESAFREKQEGNLKELLKFYPEPCKFVVLPMDMGLMGAGKVIEGIDAQHQELARLANNKKYRKYVIPFAHIDPRRDDSLQRLTQLVDEQNFKGVKIYPPLGYEPNHPRLMDEIYPFMIEKDIPLLAHCSPGVVNSREMSVEQAHTLADPDNYKVVMAKFPELRICLGHFGGIGEWRRHLDEFSEQKEPTWLSKIRKMMKSGKYPNLYTDISYTIFNFQENVTLLSVLLEEKEILGKVLFGSDFYMVKNEKYSEKRLSIDLRSVLGEEKFWRIANENPRVFLGEL